MKALLLENIHPDATKLLEAAGYEVDNRHGALGEEELVEALDGVTVLGIRSNTKVTAKVIDKAPEPLLAIGAFCIGTNQIAVDQAAARGIAVFNAPYSNTRSVVELAMGEIIAMARRLTVRDRQMHQGIWSKSASGSHEVRGRSLGIVGYGNIGSQLSIVAEAFGMSVYYFDLVDKLALGNAKRCNSLDELLETVETVSLHVDGRSGNAGLFGEAQFAKMQDRSLFLNLCRGFVVDDDSLADNIKSGHLAGGAIDVFPCEPKSAGDPFVNPLQGLDNVILTPHVGGSTQEAQVDIGHFVASHLRDYVTTGSTTMSVNLPQVTGGAQLGRRVMHIHDNVPGVLASLNAVLSAHHANIAAQSLATMGAIGYALTDITDAAPGLADELALLPDTIRVRVS